MKLHKPSHIILSIFLCFASTLCNAADTLWTNQYISNGGYIQSPGGLYTLVMQADGNLVMYRSDGSVRYVMANNGAYAVMQADGNFVEYNSVGTPLWHTHTDNGVQSHLTIQDDGDLVIFSPGIPYIPSFWRLGTDPAFGDPAKVGDVVGRDLAFTGAGYLGHLGVWDGSQIFEAGPPASGSTNAIHITSIFDFKHTPTNTGGNATYWGTATYNIPAGNITMTSCWEPSCTNYPTATVTAASRYSVALRLMQIYRIGADYTAGAAYTRSLPSWQPLPMQRGVYRCDTLVVDALQQTTFWVGPNSAQSTWTARWNDLNNGAKTPSNIYNKLKTFQ